MSVSKVLIANRGEIAIRIARAVADIGGRAVAVHSTDDAESLHRHAADESVALAGTGVSAYLDIDAIVAAALDHQCDAVHPGYGFLAENPELARRCAEVGLTFVGPSAEVLELFGHKARARQAAAASNVPVLAGIDDAVTVEQARSFLASLGPGRAMMLKAIAGGGGRGARAITDASDLDEAYERCQSEARAAFGSGDLYAEQLVGRARHIEIQIVADQAGNVVHLGERECSAQRRHQKIVEMAPAIDLPSPARAAMQAEAVRLAEATGYTNLGTFEFLLDLDGGDHYFIEANARLQVEHTVTEEVTGVDLVQTQLLLAGGSTLEELDLDRDHAPRGTAIQVRVNMETMEEDGSVRPSGGTITAYDAPGGPGVRTDGFGYAGYTTSPSFDSLLAKVIAHSPSTDPQPAIARAARALDEFRIEGVDTNIPFLQHLLARPELAAGRLHTRFVDEHIGELVGVSGASEARSRHVPPADRSTPASTGADQGLAGAQVDTTDPLALFAHDQAVKASEPAGGPVGAAGDELVGPDGSVGMPVPIQGTIVAVQVAEGDQVRVGSKLVVMEAMKMEHVITADRTGIVRAVRVSVGDVIREGFPIVFIEEADVDVDDHDIDEAVDPDHIRDDLAELYHRKSFTLDENRPDAVARRRKTGQFTARENIEALCDPGSFKEYGPLVLAAQRARRTEEWLRERTPADGLIGGLGTVNGDLFDDEAARCMAISYDYTVFAGTQGHKNHYKQDRLFELANRYRIPLVFFTEGGGRSSG